MREVEQAAVNTILNYAVTHGIKVKFDCSVEENEKTQNQYVQLQINFDESDFGQFAFFYGVEDDPQIYCSAIFPLECKNLTRIYEIRKMVQDGNLAPFVDLIIEDDFTAHLYGEFYFEQVKEETVDRLVQWLRSPIVQELKSL